jgi:arylsulfatase
MALKIHKILRAALASAAMLAAPVAGKAASLPPPAPAAVAARPNIVIILLDDMGFSDFGCYGGEIPTPNIDALAKTGIRFTQFYNSARCSPSRAALLTGLNPHQAGMGYLAGLKVPDSRGTQGRLLPRAVTIAQVLKSAGYFTAMTGKWHLGMEPYSKAWERGFDRSLMLPAGGIYFKDQPATKGHPLVAYLDSVKMGIDDPRLGKDYWYGTDLWTRWGERFIDQGVAQKKPFFLYLAHVAPHFPLMAPQAEIARFRGRYLVGWEKLREARYARQQKLRVIGPNEGLSPQLPDALDWSKLSPAQRDRFDHLMAIYAATIAHVDKSVGDLVTHLKKIGQYDNTLILVLSDNGGNAESGPWGQYHGDPLGGPTSHVLAGMDWAALENTPFQYFKHFTREGGIATPLIAHWPDGIQKWLDGSLQRDPGYVIDIMPTLVEVADASYPKTFNEQTILPMEGRSFVPAFKGISLHRDKPLFWAHEGNRAVRTDRWKAVMKYLGQWQLYDMSVDRTELHDVAAKHPDIVRRLAGEWDEWAQRTDVDPWTGPPRADWGAPPATAARDRARDTVRVSD